MQPIEITIYTCFSSLNQHAEIYRFRVEALLQLMGIPYTLTVIRVPDDGMSFGKPFALVNGVELFLDSEDAVEHALEATARLALHTQIETEREPLFVKSFSEELSVTV